MQRNIKQEPTLHGRYPLQRMSVADRTLGYFFIVKIENDSSILCLKYLGLLDSYQFK